MVTVMYVIGTIYRTRLLGLRFVERKEACIGRELWRFFLRYPVFDSCHGEEKIASCVGIAFRNLFATDSYRLLEYDSAQRPHAIDIVNALLH